MLNSDEARICDVTLMRSTRMESHDKAAHDEARFANPFDLGFDLAIAPVLEEHGRMLYEASRPCGVQFNPTPQFGFAYAFVRTEPPRDRLYTWDPDNRLRTAIALSRLVHPTSLGWKFGARVVGDLDSPHQCQIIPAPIGEFGTVAWVADPSRDWLTPAHASTLRELYGVFFAPGFERPSRVSRAMWFHEYASRCAELDARCPFVVSGLEALINTGSHRATAQFVARIRSLGDAVGAPRISGKDANAMYTLRSSLVHGQRVDAGSSESRRLYARMEDVLRCAVRRAILEPDFGTVFESEEAINSRFPMTQST